IIPLSTFEMSASQNSVNIGALSESDFVIPARGRRARVIVLGRNQLYTEHHTEEPAVVESRAVADTDRDLLKITVVERHKASGRPGLGFVRGFGLKRGALAASIGHDSHNVIAIGADDKSICRAVSKVAEMQGGIAAADGDRIEAALELPIAGLLSNRPIEEVGAQMNELKSGAHRLGSVLEDPFMTMSFLALPVIPKLKITDRGLVDVTRFTLVDLFVEG